MQGCREARPCLLNARSAETSKGRARAEAIFKRGTKGAREFYPRSLSETAATAFGTWQSRLRCAPPLKTQHPPGRLKGCRCKKGSSQGSIIREPRMLCKGKSPSNEYHRGSLSNLGAVRTSTATPVWYTTPNFLDILAAGSQNVAFYGECDPNRGDRLPEIFIMSGKYCRFCC